jgi:SAM-dependent methyltransferase
MVGEPKTAARFNDRVADYAAHRPGYPPEMIAFLRDELGLGAGPAVADVGSGTGILAALLLREGCRVFAVEPNAAMRAAAEAALGGDPNFTSITGTAEETTLPDACVDFAAAAQAFHWFDAEKARGEFRRILKPGGRAVVVWNSRRTDSTPFLRDYEQLLRRFGTDYAQVAATYGDEGSLRKFFAAGYGRERFDNFQLFDFDGLRGRLLSASYVPLAGHPAHGPMLAELRRLFDAHQRGGRVRVEYDTDVYYGEPSAVSP